MLYLRRFSLPGQGAEASFLARDSENKRTCYGSHYPFGIFLSRKVPPLTFEPITILCGGNGCGCNNDCGCSNNNSCGCGC